MIGKILWLLTTLLLAYIQLAEAQQPKTAPRIGWLAFGISRADRSRHSSNVYARWGGSKELRLNAGTQTRATLALKEIAAELVRFKVDLMVVRDPVGIRPAMRATNTIPIIIAS